MTATSGGGGDAPRRVTWVACPCGRGEYPLLPGQTRDRCTACRHDATVAARNAARAAWAAFHRRPEVHAWLDLDAIFDRAILTWIEHVATLDGREALGVGDHAAYELLMRAFLRNDPRTQLGSASLSDARRAEATALADEHVRLCADFARAEAGVWP